MPCPSASHHEGAALYMIGGNWANLPSLHTLDDEETMKAPKSDGGFSNGTLARRQEIHYHQGDIPPLRYLDHLVPKPWSDYWLIARTAHGSALSLSCPDRARGSHPLPDYADRWVCQIMYSRRRSLTLELTDDLTQVLVDRARPFQPHDRAGNGL
jgi:hypothetical protein